MTVLQNVYLLARDVPKLGQVAIGPFSNQTEIERLFEIVDRSKFELTFAIMPPAEFIRRFGEVFRSRPKKRRRARRQESRCPCGDARLMRVLPDRSITPRVDSVGAQGAIPKEPGIAEQAAT
jgi:hypothetical protein